jgi:hypothetical protein
MVVPKFGCMLAHDQVVLGRGIKRTAEFKNANPQFAAPERQNGSDAHLLGLWRRRGVPSPPGGKMRRFLQVALVVAAALAVAFVTTSAAQGKEQASKVGKKGEIALSEQTMVGNLTLKPGVYIFQHRVEGEDHFVHFTKVTEKTPYSGTSSGVPKAHPGYLKCELERLNKKVDTTAVYTIEEGGMRRITRIEIAGENVAHIF